MNASDIDAATVLLPFTELLPPAPARVGVGAIRPATIRVIMVLGYGLLCGLCLVLVAHLRHNRADALKGNSSAARRVLLPAFEPLLWILAATTGVFTLTLFSFLVLDVFASGTPKVASECYYCGRQFVFLLVMVFLHQQAVSLPALRRSVVISFVLATYTIPFVVYTTYWGDAAHASTYFQVQRALRLLLVAWYVYVFIRPPSRASKRSIREFCGFTFMYQALSLTAAELMHMGYSSTGFTLTIVALLWAALCPLVIWRVLRADTEHWRGMGQRACALQSLCRHKNPLVYEHLSSQGLHVLLEMHRKLVIDFAYLDLKHKIGAGASAVVFSGLLHSRTAVAVKVYTPQALNDDVLTRFSQEAALCGTLSHPNIVTFHGMCVCPPTICLVFELCQGSLETVLHADRQRDTTAQFHRQTPSISVGYMIDAARAVAYLHSFEPGLLHRDIKPANFLVDSEHNVKLADFGESRSVASLTDSATDGSGRGRGSTGSGGTCAPPRLSGVIVPSPTVLEMRAMAQKMTVKGTVDYMAPELINGKGGFACYGEAADVFSLAMTMWDILHPGQERYPGCSNNHLHVFQAVLDGRRPTMGSHVHATLRELITSAWHVDPRVRPSAQTMVSTLEAVQEEVCAAFLLDGFEDMGVDSVALLVSEDEEDDDAVNAGGDRVMTSAPGTFCGAEAVDQLVRNQYVASESEALRMGRMWLDAGFLHHVKHTQGFSHDDAQFYLDEDAIRLCQPLDDTKTAGVAHVRPASSTDGRTHSSSVGNASSRRGRPTSETNASSLAGRTAMCSCRAFGQRLRSGVKPTRRQRFQRKKVKRISETNVLAASLLTPDGASGSSSGGYAGFTDFAWHLHDPSTSTPK